ncbi:MAG: ATPase [Salinirussus sp.]
MSLLVAGGARVDAGKTTFATGLIARTGATGFKPRAGNDYWFHHDDYREAVEQGRLYGRDARRLAAASPADPAPETINPVHRCWRPTPGRSGPLGQDDRSFVLDRAGDRYVVNGAVTVPESAREHLPLEEALVVESLDGLNGAMERLHVPAIEALAADVRATDRAVVESYGDVARPLRAFEPDAVAVVEPGSARVFAGDRYAKACQITSGSPVTGQLEERVSDVTDLAEPVDSIDLPPLRSADRDSPDAVAAAYAPAYDRLLDVAGW